jgi:hypothetical protein
MLSPSQLGEGVFLCGDFAFNHSMPQLQVRAARWRSIDEPIPNADWEVHERFFI